MVEMENSPLEEVLEETHLRNLTSVPIATTASIARWLILGFRVLAEECAGCDHRTHVR